MLPTLDSLSAGSPLQVFAEFTLDIAFTIAVRPGVTEPASIAAYPVARAQVTKWAAKNLREAKFQAADSNAAAAVDVAPGPGRCSGDHGAGRRTLRVGGAGHGRHRRSQRAHPICFGRTARPPPARTGADRTSVVLRLDNVPGALVSALTEFAIRDIDLTRIESRPTRTELGTYIFFLDCVGHVNDDAVAEALEALHSRCTDVRNLGSWPTGSAGAVRKR